MLKKGSFGEKSINKTKTEDPVLLSLFMNSNGMCNTAQAEFANKSKSNSVA